MARCRMEPLAWAGNDGATSKLAAVPAITFVASRRVIKFLISGKTRMNGFCSREENLLPCAPSLIIAARSLFRRRARRARGRQRLRDSA